MKDERTEPPQPPPEDERHPFELRFTEFARRIIAIPKSEIEERASAYQKRRQKGERQKT